MKRLIMILLASGFTACASKPVYRGFTLPPAMSETLRGGELKGLESNDTGLLGMPNERELVSHTCTSTPIFNIYGQFVRTSVHCW